jgi:hypothetical protein
MKQIFVYFVYDNTRKYLTLLMPPISPAAAVVLFPVDLVE